MAGVPIAGLYGLYAGEDIWIIAAGPSAGYVDPEFFRNKFTLGVNKVWMRFEVDYVVCKDFDAIEMAVKSGQRVIASKHHCGTLDYRENADVDGTIYIFEHGDNGIKDVDLDAIGSPDRIVVSFSTITSTMHLAAFMGAVNIIVVGHDCGMLDGRLNFEDYPDPPAPMAQPGFYESFVANIEPQSIAVRDRLQEVYGCRIYSLNPFLNFGLEGKCYERAK